MGRIRVGNKNIVEGIDLMDAIRKGELKNQRLPLMLGNAIVDDIDDKKVKEIRQELEKIKTEIEEMKIDYSTEIGKAQVVMYLYQKFQREIKYFHPIHRGMSGWNPFPDEYRRRKLEDVANPYGALVNKYALCLGISRGMEVACKYFGIECSTISVNNLGIGHAINRINISGKNTYLDIASEIGMSRDGLYEDNKKRERPIAKEKPTLRFFGLSKNDLKVKGMKFWDIDEERVVSSEVPEKQKNNYLANILEKLENLKERKRRSSMGRRCIIVREYNVNDSLKGIVENKNKKTGNRIIIHNIVENKNEKTGNRIIIHNNDGDGDGR